MNTGSYFPIQFSPSDAPLAYIYQHPDDSPHGAEIDGTIVEARCAGSCIAAAGGAAFVDWEVTRVREDRRRELASGSYFGNDFKTAEIIWLNNFDPFHREQLSEGPALDYFMQPKSGIYRAQTSAISFIKRQRIAGLKHSGWVLDIGTGKGQDLRHYLDAEIQHLVAVDQDRAALSELVRRKYVFAKKGTALGTVVRTDDNGRGVARRGRDGKSRTATTIHVLAANASSPLTQLLDKFEMFGLNRMTADALVCNLAVHYFLVDLAAMRNFIALARGAVKIGGQVILTILIGENVHAAFINGGILAVRF
jgi:SAM-dependent methyltransferase